MRPKRLRLSREVDECKPLPLSFSLVSGALSHLGNSRLLRIIGSRNVAPPAGGCM